ncbi:hypothetical protein Acor_54620 [Acrocarpospora corrugata]|uniref:Uncharacterized protein n=1 Tax=Acrocarpospora corrugata TaxID=35763 RepID=A0A5M3W3S2_9ACTN|nr:hypothetical protein [Acrocarpospora corrugata]GES03396.1 hypothetical protein Acor_54620 [Acrocarpospora corrugata]
MTATSGGPLHLVVTCANRKRHAIPVDLHLRAVTQRRPAARFAAWTARLDDSDSGRYSAVDLYAGEHWQIARALTQTPAAKTAQLWIASAGYGLIPADAAICAYAATFSVPASDAVGVSVSEVADWWHRLSTWAGPAPDQPRSFAALAARDPDATVIAVLSAAYQRACGDDLLAAADLLDSDALSVVGPSNGHPLLVDMLVPVTATLQHTVGGSLQALNVRTTQYLLEHGAGTRRTALRYAAAAAAPDNPPTPRATGQRMSDAELVAYIHGHAHNSATQLLRQLRDTGRSCEQRRFAQLHRDVCGAHRP